jgi:hypothetical protein
MAATPIFFIVRSILMPSCQSNSLIRTNWGELIALPLPRHGARAGTTLEVDGLIIDGKKSSDLSAMAA